MKALVLTDNKCMEVQEVTEKPLADNEMKVKVKYVGICGTDKHLFHGLPGSAEVNPPIVLGHEISGVITDAGQDVKSQLKVGDRVAVDPNIPCGFCAYCRENKPQLCENMQAIGVTRDGGMAEFVNVPETNLYKIPDSLSFKEAAMAEPVSCVVYGIKQLTIKAHYTALVVGDGIIGQIFTQYLANSHLKKVDVSGRNPKKVELLKRIGATKVFNPEKVEHDEKYDIVIECVGVTATQERAIAFARRGGQVLMFGVSNPDDLIKVNAFDIFFKELTIKGAFVNPYTMQDAIQILADKTVDAEQLITHEINMDDIPDVLAGNINYKITKAVIKMNE